MGGLFAEPARVEMAPGAVHLRGWLDPDAQEKLLVRCLQLAHGDTPAYVPTVRGGGKMHVRMLCLGRHWNGRLYRYEATRTDFDGRPAPPLPAEFASLAADAAHAAGFAFQPDICIMNLYDADGRMGLHQDKDETEASLASGAPVVSISIGDTARFLFGGLRRRDPVEAIPLESGDAFVFGGQARLRYHGVTKILPGTAPPQLEYAGRVNLTFRHY
jgi:alkylated DNA repair protein (DNA oxidative demethylase)